VASCGSGVLVKKCQPAMSSRRPKTMRTDAELLRRPIQWGTELARAIDTMSLGAAAQPGTAVRMMPALQSAPTPTAIILDELPGFYDQLLARIVTIAARLNTQDGAPVVELMREFCDLVKALSQQNRALASTAAWYDVGRAMQLPIFSLTVAMANDGEAARRVLMDYCRDMGSDALLQAAAGRAVDKPELTDADISRAVWFARRGASVWLAMRAVLVRDTYGAMRTVIDDLGRPLVQPVIQHLLDVDQAQPPPPGATTPQQRDKIFSWIVPRASLAAINAYVAVYRPDDDDIFSGLTSAIMRGSVSIIRAVAALLGVGPPPLDPLIGPQVRDAFDGVELSPDKPLSMTAMYAALGPNAPNYLDRTAVAWDLISGPRHDGETAAVVAMHAGGLPDANVAQLVGDTITDQQDALQGLTPLIASMSEGAVNDTFTRVIDFHANLMPNAVGAPFAALHYIDLAEVLGPGGANNNPPSRAYVDMAYRRVGFVPMHLLHSMGAALRQFVAAFGLPSSEAVAWEAIEPVLVRISASLVSPLPARRPPPFYIREVMGVLGVDLGQASEETRLWAAHFDAIPNVQSPQYAGVFRARA